MTLTINLPEDVERQLLADAKAQGADPAALAAALIANVYRVASAKGAIEEDEEDPDAVREIGEALAEYETMRAAGRQGIPASEVFADIRATLAERRKEA